MKINERDLNRMSYLASAIVIDPQHSITYIDIALKPVYNERHSEVDRNEYNQFLLDLKEILSRSDFSTVILSAKDHPNDMVKTFYKIVENHPERNKS